MLLNRFLLLIFLASSFLFTGAQNFVPDPGVAKRPVTPVTRGVDVSKNDSSLVSHRSFDERRLKNYSKDRDFIYGDNAVVGKSLWQTFWDWFWSLFDDLFGKSSSGKFLKYLVICLMVGFLVYVVLKFSGMELNIFSGKPGSLNIPYEEATEDIHQIDFSEQIEAAIAAGNYRLAVRLYYLRTLKGLSDRNLIHWQPEKTNSTYVNEISDVDIKRVFAQLTTSFEYVWYGNFVVTPDNFSSLKERFDQFNKAR